MIELFTNNYRLVSISTFDQFMLTLLALSLVISLVYGYKRIVRRSPVNNSFKSSLHFFIIAIVNALACVSLVFLILNIERLSEDKSNVIVLTSGTTQLQIESLNVASKDQVYVLPQYVSSLNLTHLNEQAISIDSIERIDLIVDKIKNIKVYGDGLSIKEWSYLPSVKVKFFPSPIRTGISALNWSKEITQGEILNVSGTFQTHNDDKNKTFKLTLTDFNDEEVDSVFVTHGESFALTTHSKVVGLFNYHLQVVDDNDRVIADENVAFSVQDTQSVDIAIKQSAPSFETRVLKNWASDYGSKMLVLTQISKNKYMQQTTNDNENSLEDIKGVLAIDWLNKFDLLIIDGRSFVNLSKVEINVLERAVIEGLGLLILADESLLTSFKNESSPLLKGIKVIKLQDQDDRKLSIPSWHQSAQSLELNYYRYGLSSNTGKVLVKDVEGENLVVRRELALGHVALSLLTETYQWSISDNKVHYSQYWHYLISQLSRNKSQNYWHQDMDNEISFIGQNQLLCAQVDEQEIMNIYSEQVQLTKLVERPALRCGHYWPELPGWHNINLKSTEQTFDQQSRFIYQPNDWLGWQQTKKNDISRKIAKQQAKFKHEQSYQVVDKTLYWIIFFICASCLWIEQKMFNR